MQTNMNSEAKFTPDQWTLEQGMGGGYSGIIVNAKGTGIAVVCNYEPEK